MKSSVLPTLRWMPRGGPCSMVNMSTSWTASSGRRKLPSSMMNCTKDPWWGRRIVASPSTKCWWMPFTKRKGALTSPCWAPLQIRWCGQKISNHTELPYKAWTIVYICGANSRQEVRRFSRSRALKAFERSVLRKLRFGWSCIPSWTAWITCSIPLVLTHAAWSNQKGGHVGKLKRSILDRAQWTYFAGLASLGLNHSLPRALVTEGSRVQTSSSS